MVLTLFERHRSAAFISTHFLDFVRRLEADGPGKDLHFLRVQLNGHRKPNYAFEEGIAETSMAAETARRLGVTFEELAGLVDGQRAADA